MRIAHQPRIVRICICYALEGEGMTRVDIAKMVATGIGVSRTEAAELVDAVLKTICQTLEDGDGIKLSGFGQFKLRDKRSRIGRNPRTGEDVMISARRVVTFHPGAKMLERINRKVS